MKPQCQTLGLLLPRLWSIQQLSIWLGKCKQRATRHKLVNVKDVALAILLLFQTSFSGNLNCWFCVLSAKRRLDATQRRQFHFGYVTLFHLCNRSSMKEGNLVWFDMFNATQCILNYNRGSVFQFFLSFFSFFIYFLFFSKREFNS